MIGFCNESIMSLQIFVSSYNAINICNHCIANMPNIKGNIGLTKKSIHSGMMRALGNCQQLEGDTRHLTLQVIRGGRGDTCSLQSHRQKSAEGNNKESAQGKNHASQLKGTPSHMQLHS